MNWSLSNSHDPRGCALADRHYSRKKPGSNQFAPPGRRIVLLKDPDAVWCTSWPYADLVAHDYPGAMLCTIFRNESDVLSSLLVREALAATRWKYPDLPELGIVTFVNASKVRRKRDPGRCFLRAGFERQPDSRRGLVVLQCLPANWPDAEAPLGAQESLL